MSIAVGRTIKRLRQEKGVTQEELSEFLRVSCQAVSKWENDVAMPDIALLPEIAVFFGVTIDSLFALERQDLFRRIEKIYNNHGKIKSDEFEYAKKVLMQMTEDNPKDAEAYLHLKCLHYFYARQLKEKSIEYAQKGLEISPFEKNLHFGDIGSGAWRFWGNDEEKKYYGEFIKKYPEWSNGYCYLATAYLDNWEIEKATEVINQGLSLAKSNGTLEMLLGDIEIMRGNKEKAVQIWDKILKDNICDDTSILGDLGERFINNGREETGIMLYNKSHEVDTNNLSGLFSLAFYYDGKGDEEKAIIAWERIIYATEHHSKIDTEDKEKYNTWHRDMLNALRERQKNKNIQK